MSQWYYQSVGKLRGPFSLDELRYLARRGQVSGRDQVRKGESGDWMPANRVPGLLARRRGNSNETSGQSVASPPLGSVAQYRASLVDNPPAESNPVESEWSTDTVDLPEPAADSIAPPARPPAPPTRLSSPQSSADRRKRWLIGSSVAAALLLLIAVLLLLFNLQNSGGLGSGTSSQAGTGASGDGAQQGQSGQPDGDGAEQTPPGSDSGSADGTESTAESGSDPGPTPDADVVVDSTSTQSALNNADTDDSFRSAFTIGGSEFFGVTATGNRFVYIIDSSGSMDGRRFSKARDELLRSLFALEEDREFCVIFFSDDASPMFGSASLLPATQANKNRAEQWVQRFRNGGGTDPEQAIRLALGQRPDAIFLLTDGGFDVGAVSTARSLNTRKATFNTIGFEDKGGEANLKRIAADSGGKYRFVP